jgi:hypothetical protein
MARPQLGYRNSAGKKVPGVTTVLKNIQTMDGDILCAWAAKLARAGEDWRKVRQAAGDHGTMLHELCETKLPNALADGDRPAGATDEAWEKLRASYSAIRDWCLAHNPKTLIAEVPLISEEYQFGGTLDACVELDMGNGLEPWILDYKTGSMVGAKECAQMAAYRHLLAENKGLMVAGALLIHAPTKEPGYMRPVRLDAEVLDLGWELFMAARTVARNVAIIEAAIG